MASSTTPEFQDTTCTSVRAVIVEDVDDDEYCSPQTTTHAPSESQSKNQLYPWKKLIKNDIFCSRIIIIPPAFFILFLCISYTISTLLQLKLDNYWCDINLTLAEIRQHSREIGASRGVEDQCWELSGIRSSSMLWLRQSYGYEWIDIKQDPSPMFRFTLLLIMSIVLTILIIYYIILLVIDVINYRNGTLSTPITLKLQKSVGISTHPSKQNCCKQLLIYFTMVTNWFGETFTIDSRNWILFKVFAEIFEIAFQTLALWAYNGTPIIVFESNPVYLAYEERFIKIFAIFLFSNCISCTILWSFYAFKPKLCHGLLFQLLLVFVDVIFDIFYVFFPLIVVITMNENEDTQGQEFLVSLASLESTNLLSTCS